jgi:LysR family transcriptional regulator, regulator of abg operon
MTDLRLIQYFEVVYRLLSFSKAAEELHLTHSAVTRSIKTLEDTWGTKLFYRTTRSVTPTEAGERLYPMAVELLAFAKVVQRETVSGDQHLKIIGGPIAYDILLPAAITEFRKSSPGIRILADVMPPHAAIEELVQRRANLVLFNMATLEALPHAGRLQFQEIIAEDFVMLHRPGHPVAARGTAFETLLAYPWAFPGFVDYLDGDLPEGMREALTEAGAPQYTLYSPTSCMNLSMASDTLTVMPLSLAVPNLESGRLGAKRIPGLPKYRVGAAYKKDAALEPNIKAFLESLTAAARKLQRANAGRLKALG